MSSRFTVEDKELVMQFLTVLHGWVQDTKIKTRNDLDVLELQDGVIKLLYARIKGGSNMTPEEIVESADSIFTDVPEELQREPTEEAPTPEGKVIDMATWISSSLDSEGSHQDEEE